MKIGLFPGSFNPIHIGHLLIATFIAEKMQLDKIWFVVSPQNPLKNPVTLANENDRLNMVKLAIQGNSLFQASDIEFHLPTPSYTIQTLSFLKEKFPSQSFNLIIGEDNLNDLPKWKDYEKIIDEQQILVYRRNYQDKKAIKLQHTNIQYIDLPILDISSTAIRQRIIENKNIDYMVTNEVKDYINNHKLYK